MKLIIILLVSVSLSAAETPQKIKMSEDLLDRLNEIEEVYRVFLNQGMTPTEAQLAACDWQDKRYPVILQMPREYLRKKGAKDGTRGHNSKDSTHDYKSKDKTKEQSPKK